MVKKGISYFTIWIITVSSLVMMVQCSTEKDAWLNRTYHNTTARYNGYFNAGEIINEAMSEHRERREEDYNVIIPVFQYANEVESKALYPPMDTAAKKCEAVVSRHSMPSEKKGQFRKTEWCKWIDDNWLLIGQSQFYKRNFSDAMKNFKYVEKQYSDQQIIYSALLWQAKTHIEQENYEDAHDILDELIEGEKEYIALLEKMKEEEAKQKEKEKSRKKKKSRKGSSSSKKKEEDKLPPKYPKNFDREIAPVYADLLLRQEKYVDAIEKLEQSIEIVKKKEFRTRLTFILAQIHHKLGNQEASTLYAKVVKMNPDYDMAFQAKINRALAFSGGNSLGIKSELLKMLKDDKNVDYLDQIYFALADIELRNDNKEQGINYLELSIASSTSNNDQKSKSFLRLGKLYYSEKNYVKAQQYYDSTMAVLPNNHPEFENIETTNVSLSELVKNLDIINAQDSIVSLCSLSEKELLSKIDDIIQAKKEEDERLEEEQNNITSIAPFNNGNSIPGNSGGVFWVWDNNLKGAGFNDFKNTWGNRKLEDDWRRKDKSSVNTEEGELDGSDEEKEEYTVEYYLKDLPCSKKEEMDKINNDIIDALYEVGTIYKVKLEDEKAAIKPFTTLINNYLPQTKAIAALYQLYLLSSGENKSKFKTQILDDYPNSEYAKIIGNPDYKQNEQLSLEQDAALYSKTYNQVQVGNLDAAIKTCNQIISKDSTNAYLCKFYYLKSVAIGKKNGGVDKNKELENSLEAVVTHCQGDPVFNPAQASLNKLRNVVTKDSKKEKYIFDASLSHYFVIVVPNGEGNTNKIKSDVSNFNSASFSSLGLKTSNTFLNPKTQLIFVKSFKNAEAAKDYHLSFKVNEKQVKELKEKYQYFIISNKNYAVLYADKSIPEYLEFFTKYYE